MAEYIKVPIEHLRDIANLNNLADQLVISAKMHDRGRYLKTESMIGQICGNSQRLLEEYEKCL